MSCGASIADCILEGCQDKAATEAAARAALQEGGKEWRDWEQSVILYRVEYVTTVATVMWQRLSTLQKG